MSNAQKASKPDLSALLAEAKLPERTVEVCLRGDLAAQVEDLERDLAKAREQAKDRLVAGSEAREIAERIERLREEMRQSTVVFRLRAMPRRKWAEVIAAHPVRPDSDEDKALGFNSDTFFDGLVRECTVEPQLTDEQWEALLDTLTSRQFDELSNCAWGLNRREVSVPFSVAASQILRPSDETS